MLSFRFSLLCLALVSCSSMAMAQRGLTDIPDSDPAAEQATFTVADGFEVNLFASDPMIAKPIQINWDAQGRLWVASSHNYPHLKPGLPMDDQVLVLEDKNRDGVADQATVFADDLLIPTGVLPGRGGVYVANSTELLYLKDTDNDLKYDEKQIVFSGFGTEDTHHIIHTFHWAPDASLTFNQSIYTHSHVETPWGIRRLLAGGIWRMQPELRKLEVVARGMINPWGTKFDDYGQIFATDGAGSQGIHYVIPEGVYATAYNAKRVLPGLNPGQPKHCGLEILEGPQFEGDWQGRYVTCDFRGNRINSFQLSRFQSGYVAQQKENLIASTHVAFRPIDIAVGPDGAIYIADWYNPIIQHGEVDFRDERRDHTHGRIWRISRKGQKAEWSEDFTKLSTTQLLEQLKSDRRENRQQSRRILIERGNSTLEPLTEWLNAQKSASEELKLQALWIHQGLHHPEMALLKELLYANEARVRAASLRVAHDWGAENPKEILAAIDSGAKDPDPQVRLEAVHLARVTGTLEALKVIAQVENQSVDPLIDFALWTTAQQLADQWQPAFEENPEFLGKSLSFTIRLLESAPYNGVQKTLQRLWTLDRLAKDQRLRLLQLFAGVGGTEEIAMLFEQAFEHPEWTEPIFATLIEAAQKRKVVLTDEKQALQELLRPSVSPALQAKAVELVGAWKLKAYVPVLIQKSEAAELPAGLRRAAIGSLARLNTSDAIEKLKQLSGQQGSSVQQDALKALLSVKPGLATQMIVQQMANSDDPGQMSELLRSVLSLRNGPPMLVKALEGKTLSTSMATMGLRQASTLSKPSPQLVAAFRKAGKLSAKPTEMTAEQLQEFLADVQKLGNRYRGELIYRRKSLACQQCHAISGAGGKVGPDLGSIGASAPVDYLVDSLLKPSVKIKEGYHTLNVVTIDGLVKTGTPVRESQEEVVIRLANGTVETILTEDIELKQIAPVSLMPADLMNSLQRDEMIDLVAFLSQLGKDGGLKSPTGTFVRTWEVLDVKDQAQKLAVNDTIRHGGAEKAPDDPTLPWTTYYSYVGSNLRLEDLAWMGNIGGRTLQYARFRMNARNAGEVTLQFNSVDQLQLWVDGKLVKSISEVLTLPLTEGEHVLMIASETAKRTAKSVQIQIQDRTDSKAAQVELP